MTVEQVGPWLLLIIGIVLLGCFAKAALQTEAAKTTLILLFVGGFACAGTGIYGPSFMNEHGRWIQTMLAAFNSQDPKAYDELLAQVADGSVPPEYQPMVLAAVMDNAPKDIDPKLKLNQAIAQAPSGTGRQSLIAAQQRIEEREAALTTVLAAIQPKAISDSPTRTTMSAKTLDRLDSASRRVVSETFSNMTRQQLKAIRVDPEVITKIQAVQTK